jgi:Xaa-Pro aminopeptidase
MSLADFSQEEYEDRLALLQAQMEVKGIDGMLVCDKENYRYITGHITEFYFNKARVPLTWVPKDGEPVLVVQEVERLWAEEISWCSDVRFYGELLPSDVKPLGEPDRGFEQDLVKVAVDAARDRGFGAGSTLGIPRGSHMRVDLAVDVLEGIREGLSDARWVDVAELLWTSRMVKSEQEIRYLRDASTALDRTYALTIKEMAPGKTELEIARFMRGHMFLEGADGVAYTCVDDIRAHGLTSPSDRKMPDRAIYHIDGGTVVRGYAADFSRLVSIGSPSDREQQAYATTVEAHYAGIDAARAGVRAGDVATAIYAALEEGGADHVGVGRCGHGTGLEQPEPPSLHPEDQTELRAGMVLSIEPVAFFNDVGYLFTEDMVAVEEDGPPSLLTEAPTPRELLVAGA